VHRKITRILTQGTLVDETFIVDKNSVYLLCVKESLVANWEAGEFDGSRRPRFGVCFVDTAVGHFYVGEFVDDAERTQFETLILQLKPQEIIYEKGTGIILLIIFVIYLIQPIIYLFLV